MCTNIIYRRPVYEEKHSSRFLLCRLEERKLSCAFLRTGRQNNHTCFTLYKIHVY